MNIIAFIILLVAAVLFGVDAFITRALVPIGLCLLTIGFIVQFGATTHSFTF